MLMEDANGERISITEGLPSEKNFQVRSFETRQRPCEVGKHVEAKSYVSDSKRGAAARAF